MQSHNPYTSASDAYGATAAATDQRSLEGKVLMKSAMKLEILQKELEAGNVVPVHSIGEILEFNEKIWQIFVNETMNPDHPLPQDIKNNIASLGVFIFKRTHELRLETTPAKIAVLIELNRTIASGLMKQAQLSTTPADAPAPAVETNSII